MIFTEKYFPKDFSEFIGNSEVVERVIKWALEWEKGVKQKPILLFGSPGTGKTTLAFLIAKKFNWQLFEMNASDLRDKQSIEKVAGAAASNYSLFSSKRLVLIDEVDSLQSRDRGGASAISSIIKESTNPMLLIADNAFNQKITSIRNNCEVLEFKKINYLSISKRLKEICVLEGISFEEEAIKQLAKNSSGDFRSALLDLGALGSNITLSDVESISFRERKGKIFSVMSKIFKGKNVLEIRRAVDSIDVSLDLLFLWVEENIPRQFDLVDSANAFNFLSRADIFNGRIFNRQNWVFLKYSIFLSTSGVALSRRKDYDFFQPFSFPTFLSSLSKSSSVRERKKLVATKIGKKTHSSRNRVLQNYYFFLVLFNSDKYRVPFNYYFGFNEKEAAFLLGLKEKDKKVSSLMKETKLFEQKIIASKLNTQQSKLFG